MASTGAFTGDEHFFRKMALFLTVVTIAGFGYNIGAGKVSLSGLPGVVFVHAAIFMAWIVLLIVQPTLIGRNNLLLHRRLGWAGIVLSVLIVWLGWEVTIDLMLRQPESRNGVVLAIQMLPIVCFAILVFFGIILRKRSDWHRRLMLCATITLTAPAWARLLPGWAVRPVFSLRHIWRPYSDNVGGRSA